MLCWVLQLCASGAKNRFHGRQFFHRRGVGDGFVILQVHYTQAHLLLRSLAANRSGTSLRPGRWGPLQIILRLLSILIDSLLNTYTCFQTPQCTGGKRKAHRLNLAPHLVLSDLAPCFYLAAALSSLPIVKEQLHLHSPKITFGSLKVTTRLMWPPMKMSLTPCLSIFQSTKKY